jgi:hypothetical protein
LGFEQFLIFEFMVVRRHSVDRECRRCPLYLASMKCRKAIPASELLRSVVQSISSHSSVAMQLAEIALPKQSPTDAVASRTLAHWQRRPKAIG